MLRRFARIWALAGLGALVCAAGLLLKCWSTSVQLAALELRCRPLYELQNQIQQDHQQLELMQSRCAMLRQLQPADHLIDLLGVLVQATQAEPGKLHVQRLTLQSGQPVTSAAVSNSARDVGTIPATPLTLSTLSLTGLAQDDASLTDFIVALRQAGVFERVELKVSSQAGGSTGTARQYQLECRYEDLP